MKAAAVFELLQKREYFGMKLGLARVAKCLAELNNPQDSFDSVHVAGTNGKGSTCAMIACSLRKAGYKTGLFTSPHLIKFNERIQINGKLISDTELDSLYNELKPFFDDYELTFFEATTVIAFVYFKRKGVEKAVVEVGLGGRLDSTNVLTPKVSVITDIGFDHMKHLGNTIYKITFEKTGIIKPSVPVVVAKDNVGIKVVLSVAKEKNSKVIFSSESNFPLGLSGEFQKRNAALASSALKLIGVSSENIAFGLARAVWPARMQLVVDVLVDGAHNELGAQALCRELKSIPKKKILVIGILADKEYKKMLAMFSAVADFVIFTSPKGTKRAAKASVLAKAFPKNKVGFVVVPSIKKALLVAQNKKQEYKNSVIVVCGSLTTAGEALNELNAPLF